jgi:hypothetical protein
MCNNCARIIDTQMTLDAAAPIQRSAIRSVIYLKCRKNNKKGTAFLTSNGTVVTAAHVVCGAEEPQLGRVSDLDIERSVDKTLARHMEVHVHLELLPLDSQVAVDWTVRDRTGNIVAHKAQVLNSDERNARDKEYEFNFVAPAKGRYTAKVDLAVTTHTGVIPEGQIKSSSRTFEID